MEDFVSFEIAKKLKEKGFREGCFGYYGYCEDVFYYNVIQNPIPSRQLTFKDFKDIEDCQNVYPENGSYDAPTISQVLKWLREEKKLFIEISCNYTDYFPTVRLLDSRQTDYIRGDVIYSTYEQAALAGIEYVLDNLI